MSSSGDTDKLLCSAQQELLWSLLSVVRSEHVRTLFDRTTQSQEYKSQRNVVNELANDVDLTELLEVFIINNNYPEP